MKADYLSLITEGMGVRMRTKGMLKRDGMIGAALVIGGMVAMSQSPTMKETFSYLVDGALGTGSVPAEVQNVFGDSKNAKSANFWPRFETPRWERDVDYAPASELVDLRSAILKSLNDDPDEIDPDLNIQVVSDYKDVFKTEKASIWVGDEIALAAAVAEVKQYRLAHWVAVFREIDGQWHAATLAESSVRGVEGFEKDKPISINQLPLTKEELKSQVVVEE